MGEYAKNVVGVMKGRGTILPLYLNLQKEQQCKIVSEYFGGEDIMKRDYPCLYSKYSSAKQVEAEESEYIGYCDGALLSSFTYISENKLRAVGRINLTKRASNIFASISIMDGDTVIRQKNQMFFSKSTVSIECVSDEVKLVNTDALRAYLHVSWEPEGETYLHSMLTQSNELNRYIDFIKKTDTVEKVIMCHPTETPHKEYDNLQGAPLGEKIIVSYNRTSQQGNVDRIDYTYNTPYNSNRGQRLFQDISYKAILKKGVSYNSLQNLEIGAVLCAVGVGDVYYMNEAKTVKATKLEDGRTELWIQYNMDWNNFILQSVQAGNRLHDFFAQATLYVQYKPSEETKIRNEKIQITASSMNDVNDINDITCIKVEPLYLFWGCLAEDTLILMSDGSEKEIKDIAVGERLQNEKGEVITVTNILKGSKEIIYHTFTSSGKKISATLLHPFASESGDILLREFKDGTKLKIKNQKEYVYESVENCYPEEYQGSVYSLEVQGGTEKTIIANGFVTYANSEVARIEQQYIVDELVMSEGEQKEYDLLKQRLEEREYVL